MDDKIREVLRALNRDFYARFADPFARTRRSWPPGFAFILPYLRHAANVLDLGCGNGRLLSFLAHHGWSGDYVGLDNSAGLLAEAAQVAAAHPAVRPRFLQADLMDEDWPQQLAACALTQGTWRADAIACLAVLHHIPGAANRARFLATCRALLAPAGRLVLSTWQFMTSPRLRGRVLPWETIGLQAAQVEPGDYLVAWGEGAAGRRYCAFIDLEGLRALAGEAGLQIQEVHYADGHEGNLNLYAVLSAR
ncbi:MAG: methyltransferase domain-containing protein [Anaerolineae bacterium]